MSFLDIDECADPKLNTCAENTKCLNKPGSFDCTCVPGYESTDKGTAEGKDLCQGKLLKEDDYNYY